jgi:hypothetical protein
MALAPHILAQRHISPPSILGNNLGPHSRNRSGWTSSAEVQARMDGCFPECMANLPSTLRYAPVPLAPTGRLSALQLLLLSTKVPGEGRQSRGSDFRGRHASSELAVQTAATCPILHE